MKRIVYLHGLNCTGKIFTHLKHSLPDHNATVIEYDSHASVETSVAGVIALLPNEPFSIVSHSLGGILGHLIATRGHPHLEHLVTISTPFGGSDAAGKLRWFYPRLKVFRDISAGSAVLKEIKAGKPTVPFLSLVSINGSMPLIQGDNDGVVSLASQRAAKATRRVEVSANHFEIVQDEATVAEITKFVF